MTDDTDRSNEGDGVLGKVKATLAKAAQGVTGLFKKDDAGTGAGATGATASGKPTERSVKMKKAVEDARKAKED